MIKFSPLEKIAMAIAIVIFVTLSMCHTAYAQDTIQIPYGVKEIYINDPMLDIEEREFPFTSIIDKVQIDILLPAQTSFLIEEQQISRACKVQLDNYDAILVQKDNDFDSLFISHSDLSSLYKKSNSDYISLDSLHKEYRITSEEIIAFQYQECESCKEALKISRKKNFYQKIRNFKVLGIPVSDVVLVAGGVFLGVSLSK